MDRKIANNVIVGMFVTLGLVGLIFVLFNIGDGHGLFQRQYSIVTHFREARGLHHGSEVNLAGLHVGIVRNISVLMGRNRPVRLELGIDKKFQGHIRRDSMATIKTQGVLGDKYIEISVGSPSSPELSPGAELDSFEESDLFTKSNDLIADLSKELGPGGRLALVLHNLNAITDSLRRMTRTVETQPSLLHEVIYGDAGASFAASLSSLKSVLQKVDSGTGTLGALVNDPSVYEDIRVLLGGAKRSRVLRYFLNQYLEAGKGKK